MRFHFAFKKGKTAIKAPGLTGDAVNKRVNKWPGS